MAVAAANGDGPRLRLAERQQLSWQSYDLDALIGPAHRARAIWEFLNKLDLSDFYTDIKAREGVAGRDATDPRILLALWLYALSRGIGSARELARLCLEHNAYKWICGGVTVNYHMLSDFRVMQSHKVDRLLSQILGVLLHKGILKLYRIAQDGTRVRASAGAASFRRKPSLESCLAKARAQIEALNQEPAYPGPQPSVRVRAARRRHARQRQERLEQALVEYEQLAAVKAKAKNHPQRKKETRVSTTRRRG